MMPAPAFLRSRPTDSHRRAPRAASAQEPCVCTERAETEARGRRRLLSADGEGVLAADAVAEARDVGTVDVHRDGHGVAGVADAVDVAGWREAAHGPGRVDVAGGEPEHAAAVGQREDLLVLA